METYMEQVLSTTHPEHFSNNPNKGWIDRPDIFEPYCDTLPNTVQMMADLRPVQDDKPIILTKFHRDLLGRDPDPGPQGIGDCVSWGYGNCVNIFQAVQIQTQKAKYGYEEASTESIYALSRCEIGQQFGSYVDGSVGAWASKALTTKGCLSRTKVGPYDPKRAKEWGAKGLPDNLEPEALTHLFKTAVNVRDYDQAIQLIQAGYPVPVCSSQGFGDERDQDGFLRPRGRWNHCMLFAGCRFDREGLLCLQSWGKDVPGGSLPIELMPTNSFWVDRATAASMLAKGDSYAFTDSFAGFKPNDHVLDWAGGW
jgi:hypothetical protein